jgi:predicted acetyltransferase
MTHEVRIATDDRLGDVLRAVETAFGEEVADHEVETKRRTIDIGRVIYIEDEGDIVAGGGAYTFRATVPGSVLPTAGVTLIGVKPSHRRRGLLRAMMEHQLHDIHEREEPIAMLWASEGAIYQRFGYGLASVQSWLDIESNRGIFVNDPGPRGRIRMLRLEDALETIRPIYDGVQARTPGMFERTDAWWDRRVLADPKEWREGASPKYLAVWEEDSVARAYAFYRIDTGWSHAGPIGNVQLWELLALDDKAYREMWRYVFSIDLVDRVKSRGSMLAADSPLYLMLLEPRRLRATFSDGLWLRVVDVPSALEGRGFAAEGTITLDIKDELCPWNEGRWSVTAGDGSAEVTRSDRDADLSLDVSTLGAAYLGTFTFAQLQRAGRVAARSQDAVRLADALFRTDVAPYCPEIF